MYPDVIGGAEIFTSLLSRELAKKGFKIHLITARGAIFNSGFANGVYTYAYWLPPFKGKSLIANFQIFRILLKIKPAVCIGISHRCLPALKLYSRLTKTPYVVRLIGPHFYKILCKELNIFKKHPIHYVINLVIYKLTRSDCAFICQNQEMYDSLMKLGISNVYLIPNPVEPVYFNIEPRIDGYNILFIGRLAQQKGVDVLFRAFIKIANEIPESKLILVGDGPFRDFMQKMVENSGIGDRIILVGFVPHSEIVKYLHNASVFVLPSLFEGLPNALLQAMAAGLPCIATNVGGIPDILIDKVNGILVPPKRDDLLAEALKKVLLDKHLAVQLGENARKTVLHLKIDNIINLYANLIKKLMGKNVKPSKVFT